MASLGKVRFLATLRLAALRQGLADAVFFLFGIWTVLCHVTVALEQNLYFLLGASGLVLALGLAALGWGRRRHPAWGLRDALLEGDLTLVPLGTPPEDRKWFRTVVVFASAATVAIIAQYWVGRDGVGFVWLAVAYLFALALQEGAPRYQLAPVRTGLGPEVLHALLVVASVVLTLICHRASSDDTFYVNTAVAIADAPELPIMTYNTMVGVPGVLIHAAYYKVHTYEVLAGALSYLTGLQGLVTSHVVLPVIFALALPAAIASVATTLVGRRWIMLTVFVIAFYVLEGSAYDGFSNHAFVRMQHGKAAMLTLGVPLLICYTLRFAVAPTLRRGVMLASISATMIGLSSTGIMLVPIVTGISALTVVRPTLQSIKALALTALASSYPLVVGLYVKLLMSSGQWLQSASAPSARGGAGAGPHKPPVLTDVALARVLDSMEVQVWLLAAVLVAGLFYSRGSIARRFSVFYMLGFLLLAFNPILAPLVKRTLSPIYWRVLWAAPVPLLVGMAFLGIQRSSAKRSVWLGTLVASLTAYGVFLYAAPTVGALERKNSVEIHSPTPKVPGIFPVSQWLNRLVPPRATVIAPEDVGIWLTTMHDHAYPLTTKARYLNAVLPEREAARRAALTQYIGWGSVEYAYLKEMGVPASRLDEELLQALKDYNVKAVCLAPWNRRLEPLQTLLKGAGLRKRHVFSGFEFWLSPDVYDYYPGVTSSDTPPPEKK